MRFWSLAVAVATFYLHSQCGRVKKWFSVASEGGPCGKLFLNGQKPHGLDQAAIPMDHTCQCSGNKCFYVAVLRQHRHIPIYWAYSVQVGWPYSHSAEEFANWISNWSTDPQAVCAMLRKNQSMKFRKFASKVPGFVYIVSGIVPSDGEDWTGITQRPNRTSATWSAYHHRGAGRTFEGALIKKDQNASHWLRVTVKQLEQVLSERFVTAGPVQIFCNSTGTRPEQSVEGMDGGQTERGVQREKLTGKQQSAAKWVILKEDKVNLKNENKYDTGSKGQTAHLEIELMTQIDYTEPENLGRKPVQLKDILQIQEIQTEKAKQKREFGIILTEQIPDFLRKKLSKFKKVVCVHCGGREDGSKQYHGVKHNDPGSWAWKEDKPFEEKLEPRTPPDNSKPLNQSERARENPSTHQNGSTQVDTKPAECNTTFPEVTIDSNTSKAERNESQEGDIIQPKGNRKTENKEGVPDDKYKNTGSYPETIRFETPPNTKEAPYLMLGHVTEDIQSDGRGFATEEQKALSLSGDPKVGNVGAADIGLEETGCNMTVLLCSRCVGLIHRTAATLQHCVYRKTLHRSKKLLRMRTPFRVHKTQNHRQEKDSHVYVFNTNMYNKRQTYKSCRGLVHPSRKCHRRGLKMVNVKGFLIKDL